MTAPTQVFCIGCKRRIGKRGTVLVIGGTTPLCAGCATSTQIHRRMFWSCRVPGHVAADHSPSISTTRGRARELLGAP